MTAAMLGTSKHHPDWNRALALGVAVAINLAALGALTVMQPSWQPAAGVKPVEQIMIAEWLVPPLPVPEIPVAPTRAIVPPTLKAEPVRAVEPAPADATPMLSEAVTPVEAIASSVGELPDTGMEMATVTGLANSRDAGVALPNPSPPPYPIISVRKRQEGTVLLSVLVSATGTASEVRVLRGSGHRELDRSAREHVLRAWSFQPALREGKPVAAWVRVPIEFSLDTR